MSKIPLFNKNTLTKDNMDSTKAAYEPVSTEEEPVVAENAADTAPIVETTPIVDTPPEVAEKNEKNAEKSAEADKVDAAAAEEEKKEEETAAEQNGNVSLDLDSSIVPLKEVSFDGKVLFFGYGLSIKEYILI